MSVDVLKQIHQEALEAGSAPMPPEYANPDCQRYAATVLFKVGEADVVDYSSDELAQMMGRVIDRFLEAEPYGPQSRKVRAWIPQWEAYLQGESDREIAAVLGYQPATIADRRNNSYKTLRRIIGAGPSDCCQSPAQDH